MPLRMLTVCLAFFVFGCAERSPPPEDTAEQLLAPSSHLDANGDADADDDAVVGSAFPVIPPIMVPSIVGPGDAQIALESSMQALIDPIEGITVRPANCASDGALINESGYTNLDARGNLERIGEQGVFTIAADGSGTAVAGGGVVEVRPDGSGQVVNSAGTFDINADGSGTYVGDYGVIELDGKGGGSWVGDHGAIQVNGDGSGSWVGDGSDIQIHADGSGSWIGGPEGIVENRGDGTGTIGVPGREVKMAPLSPVPSAGRFPLLDKFAPPGAPCGFVITLSDRVLFDFDKSDVRQDAARVLDMVAAAVGTISARTMEVRGHTDAKGSEEYNQSLSERRAEAVVSGLRQRGVAKDASAIGYGESQPIAPNEVAGKDNPGGRQLNRRVEIFIRT